MWIIVQIAIFLFLVGVAILLPENIYNGLLTILIVFSFINIFAPWLLIVQIANILISGGIGLSIIEWRNGLFKKN